MGNSFLNDSPELLVLEIQNIINESVVHIMEASGRDQYNDDHKSVIVERTRSIHDGSI